VVDQLVCPVVGTFNLVMSPDGSLIAGIWVDSGVVPILTAGSSQNGVVQRRPKRAKVTPSTYALHIRHTSGTRTFTHAPQNITPQLGTNRINIPPPNFSST
jgi:hypothetical protein